MANLAGASNVLKNLKDGISSWTRSHPQYSPLNSNEREIRLLKILPNDQSPCTSATSALCCVLETFTLDSNPHFDALSYTWGSWWRSKTIRVDGRPTSVTKNLHEALTAFRRNNLCENYLWVDALCINQLDVAERESQVSLIRDIFRSAALVGFQLGEEKRYTRVCFNTILDGKPLTAKISILEDERFLEGIADILLRSWWRRLWVVQEVTLAREVIAHCGDLAVDFRHLLKNLISHIHFLSGNRSLGHASEGADIADGQLDHSRPSSRFNIITPSTPILLVFAKVEDMSDGQTVPIHVIRQLGRLTTMDVTLNHDRLYGILGLCPSALNTQPRYTASIDTVFEDGAVRLVSWSQSLELLRHAGLARSSGWSHRASTATVQTPSWVPRWNIEQESWNNTSGRHLDGFSALGHASFIAKQPKPGNLIVKALLVDSLQIILKDTFQRLYQEIAFDVLPLVEASSILRSWRKSYREAVPSLDGDEQSLSFWRTLVFDCMADEHAAKMGKIGWRRWQEADSNVANALDEWLEDLAKMTEQLRRVLYRVMREG